MLGHGQLSNYQDWTMNAHVSVISVVGCEYMWAIDGQAPSQAHWAVQHWSVCYCPDSLIFHSRWGWSPFSLQSRVMVVPYCHMAAKTEYNPWRIVAPPAWNNSALILQAPAAFPSFNLINKDTHGNEETTKGQTAYMWQLFRVNYLQISLTINKLV